MSSERDITCAAVVDNGTLTGRHEGAVRAECAGVDADGSACLSLVVSTIHGTVTLTLNGNETRRLRAQIDEALRGPEAQR